MSARLPLTLQLLAAMREHMSLTLIHNARLKMPWLIVRVPKARCHSAIPCWVRDADAGQTTTTLQRVSLGLSERRLKRKGKVKL